ncbi:MAG: putative zinc-binding protein, partial [Halobacteriota archaeon]
MKGDDRQVLLLTCSGVSHTGRLTTSTGTWLRYRHPKLITRHLQLTALKRPLDEELRDEENLVAVDGCEACCIKKRMDANGTSTSLCYFAAAVDCCDESWMPRVKISRSIAFAIAAYPAGFGCVPSDIT